MSKASKYVDFCLKTLKDNGHRLTKQREDVANFIAHSREWFTVKTLQEDLEKTHKEFFDFTTLYRIIQTFERLGLVHACTKTGAFFACQHLECGDPIHIIYACLDCEYILESHLPRSLADQVSNELKQKSAFVGKSSVMQISGICKNCQ